MATNEKADGKDDGPKRVNIPGESATKAWVPGAMSWNPGTRPLPALPPKTFTPSAPIEPIYEEIIEPPLLRREYGFPNRWTGREDLQAAPDDLNPEYPLEDDAIEPRYQYADVKDELHNQHLEHIFGPVSYNRSVIVSDIADDPTRMLKEAASVVNKVGKELRPQIGSALKPFNDYVFKQMSQQMSQVALTHIHKNRYIRTEFDKDPSHYEIRLEDVDTNGKTPDEIVRQILKDYFDREDLRYPVRERHDLIRSLLDRALNDIHLRERRIERDISVCFALQAATGPNDKEHADKLRTINARLTGREIQAEDCAVMREAVSLEITRYRGREIMGVERDEELAIARRYELMDTNAAKKASKRAQTPVPKFGIKNDISPDTRKTIIQMKQLMKTKYRGDTTESDALVQEYLDHCRTAISGNLNALTAMTVMIDMAESDSRAREFWSTAKQHVQQCRRDALQLFTECWYAVQLWPCPQSGEERTRKQLVDALLKPPNYYTEIFTWVSHLVTPVTNMFQTKEDHIAIEYQKDLIHELVLACLHIWYDYKASTMLAEFDNWKKFNNQFTKGAIPDVWEYIKIWQQACNGSNLNIRRNEYPTFDEPGEWVSLAHTRYSQKRQSMKRHTTITNYATQSRGPPKLMPMPDTRNATRKVSEHQQGQIRELRDVPRGNMIQPWDSASNAGSRASSRTRGNKADGKSARPAGVCWKCGSKAHFAPKCEKYGHRTGTNDHRCASCKWWHKGPCLAKDTTARQYPLHGDSHDIIETDGEIAALDDIEVNSREVTLDECKDILVGKEYSEEEESEPDFDSQISYDE